LDFARLMGIFEKRGVNLVSVTQQFNTTASLGRLTLNILLSFAQFEREIIAERTQDKMAAARRKGRWVGGIPVLGYDVTPGGGRLMVNEEEARQVRAIFTLYFEHRVLSPVLDEIQKRGWTTKRWTTKKGRVHLGRAFTNHGLLRLLTNVIYTGKVHYRGQIYPGEHAAIVEEGVWRRAQEMLQRAGSGTERLHPTTPATPGRRQRDKPCDIDQAQGPAGSVPDRVPRITRLLALAIKFEGLVQEGIVKDYAELARLGRVSPARVTQIMNLLNLAPDIQERILMAAELPGQICLREISVRPLCSEVIWSRQREQWSQRLAQHAIKR